MVTLKTYSNVMEAGFAHSLLESEGIDAFLQGEHSYTLEPISALRGIRLQVPEEQAERAWEILNRPGEAPLPDDFEPPRSDDLDTTVQRVDQILTRLSKPWTILKGGLIAELSYFLLIAWVGNQSHLGVFDAIQQRASLEPCIMIFALGGLLALALRNDSSSS